MPFQMALFPFSCILSTSNHTHMNGRKIIQKLLRTYHSDTPSCFYREPVDRASWGGRWPFSSDVDIVQILAGISSPSACRSVVRIKATGGSYTSHTGTVSTMTACAGSTTTQRRLHACRRRWARPLPTSVLSALQGPGPPASVLSALQGPGWELRALEPKASHVLRESCL